MAIYLHCPFSASRRDVLNKQLTYLLASRNRVLFEKLNGVQLVTKFPGFY